MRYLLGCEGLLRSSRLLPGLPGYCAQGASCVPHADDQGQPRLARPNELAGAQRDCTGCEARCRDDDLAWPFGRLAESQEGEKLKWRSRCGRLEGVIHVAIQDAYRRGTFADGR